MDPRVRKQAEVLVDYSANVKSGETVGILGTPLAAPLIEAIYERALERGGLPGVLVNLPRTEEILYRVANDDQLRWPGFFLERGVAYFDHIITIQSPENTKNAASTDPRKQATMAEGRRELMGKYIDKMSLPERSVTVTLHPTPALAQDASMSLLDYEQFVYDALLVHDPDPVARWQELSARQTRIRDWLTGKSSITIAGPNAEITFGVSGRGWISDDGHKNYPGGEIFTSPIEDAVEGHIRFTYPAIYSGREARDVQLWFEKGKVVRAEAATSLEFLQQMLDVDEGARRLGELAIGTNQGVKRFTGNVLFDEKIAGTCHLAIGRGFPNIGSKNSSAIHWDMVCDLQQDSTISADGEVFYRDGDFLI